MMKSLEYEHKLSFYNQKGQEITRNGRSTLLLDNPRREPI